MNKNKYIILEIIKKYKFRIIGLIFFILEVWNYYSYKKLYRRLSIKHLTEREGNLDYLKWILKMCSNKDCPLKITLKTFKIFSDDQLTYNNIYTTLADICCIRDTKYNEESKNLLHEITNKLIDNNDIELIKDNYIENKSNIDLSIKDYGKSLVSPGSAKLTCIYKPFIIQSLYNNINRILYNVPYVYGFKEYFEYSPEGVIYYWVKKVAKSNNDPILIIHGISPGGGGVYMNFINKFIDRTIVLIQIPNISGSHFQEMMPTMLNIIMATNRLFDRLELSRNYTLIAHSLGTDIGTAFMNESSRIMMPKKLVLLEPICFPHECLEPRTIINWNSDYIIRKNMSFSKKISQILVNYLIFRDIYVQQVALRFLNNSIATLYREQLCPTMVALSDRDIIVPTASINEYLKFHYPNMIVNIYKGGHGDFLIDQNYSSILINDIEKFIN